MSKKDLSNWSYTGTYNLQPTNAHQEAEEESDDTAIERSPPALDVGLCGLWPQGAGKRLASSGIHQAGSCQSLCRDPPTRWLPRTGVTAVLVVTLPVLIVSIMLGCEFGAHGLNTRELKRHPDPQPAG